MSALTDNILLKVCSKIMDPVTTTDELIPSGETSSYRSNPLGLAEFTLSRRDPKYVGRSKEVDKVEKARVAGECPMKADPELEAIFAKIKTIPGNENIKASETEIYVPNVREALDGDLQNIKAYVIGDTIKELNLFISGMTPEERKIVKAGCLINYNRSR